MTGLVRWAFADVSDATSYTFLINPNQGGSPTVKKQLTPLPLTARDGALVLFEGRRLPATMEWSGTLFDQSQLIATAAWFARRHQLVVTDDLGRSTHVYITDFIPKRAPKPHHLWRFTYTVKALVLSSTLQNLLSAADSGFESGIASWAIVSGFTSISTSGAWADTGYVSLALVASGYPGANEVTETAPVPVTANVVYRVRLRYLILPSGGGWINGVFIDSSVHHGRRLKLVVFWYYTDAGSVVQSLGTKTLVDTDLGRVTVPGPQTIGATVVAPAMPTGGTNMVGYIHLTLTNGAEAPPIGGGAIVVDTLYLDSVQFSQ